MHARIYLSTWCCLLCLVHSSQFYPREPPSLVKTFSLDNSEPGLFRSLLIDASGQYAYVGAKDSVYKLRLGNAVVEHAQHDLPSTSQLKPNFRDRSTERKWWTNIRDSDNEFRSYSTISEFIQRYETSPTDETYESLNLRNRLEDYLNDRPFGSITWLQGNAFIETAQQYSSIYQAANLTFVEHCKAQAEILSLYYGNDLQMSLADTDSLCHTHIRGLTLMNDNKLFTIQTGMFGTLPVSATGTDRYSNWLQFQGEIQPLLTCVFDTAKSTCEPNQPTDQPYSSANYSGIITDPASLSDESRLLRRNTYLMPSPDNSFGKRRHCDNTPAPSRLILSSEDLSPISSGVLLGQESRESCVDGALVQLLLGGYHPSQRTFSHFSATGNGVGKDMQAVYIITEIGQEKQQDLMLHYLNLPEIYPLGSSASLAMVRLLLDTTTGDVDPHSIVISNPFKYTWVTSPLNRFGRLDKTASQEQVAYIPKPVGLHEDENYVYFFFREADWENIPVPSHSIRRYHHRVNSYSHALYFPWEKLFLNRSYIKHEETPGETFEELYAPAYIGWQHINDNMHVTGRVARVSKDDAGLPLALTDASLFDLDHKLSLTTFQTFVKSRLTCRVPVAGVPFVWRLMKDTTRMGANNDECFTEVKKAKNLYSKDLHYRSVAREGFVSVQRNLTNPNPQTPFPLRPVLKYFYLSHCKGYRWSYVPKPKRSSALYVEYTELRDFFSIGNTFYGVFSLPLANEQLHSFESSQSKSHKPSVASAICSFSMSDIQASFDGPFKKRDKATGNFRPHGRKDMSSIQPSPYSRDNDEAAKNRANSIQEMNINFLDPTQSYSEETRNVDLRRYSSRVNFFEEDVFGSRTMWEDVKTSALLSEPGVVFESIVAEDYGESTMLYVASNEGTIYKILTTQPSISTCRMTDKAVYLKWLNRTESMSSIWDNEVYAYLNRTVDKVTFAASFQSDLTMEKDVTFPDDMLMKSNWDCTPSALTKILAVFKPFEDKKVKIWDMKLSGEGNSATLIVATDEQVLQIPTVQCGLYTHCNACIADPQCTWVDEACTTSNEFGEAKGSIDCSCQLVPRFANVAEDVVLSGLNQPIDLTKVQWYINGTALQYRQSRVMLGHDTSLILFNVTPSSSGMYELRDRETNKCLALYQLSLTDCEDEVCRYEIKYQDWCNAYDDFLKEMAEWRESYESYGYCSNLL